MSFESWIAFCSIALLAAATPGPAVLLVSVTSLSYGFEKSLVTILGNVSGLFIMSGFSVLGLSAIVLHSVIAFTIVKILGAAYLIYMGIKLWKKGVGKVEGTQLQSVEKSIWGLYTQGLLVALTNPKAILFTTALFPQFIDAADPLLPQFFILVLSFMSLSFICLSIYSLLALRVKFRTKDAFSNNLLGKIFGSTFIGAGCLLAVASK